VLATIQAVAISGHLGADVLPWPDTLAEYSNNTVTLRSLHCFHMLYRHSG